MEQNLSGVEGLEHNALSACPPLADSRSAFNKRQWIGINYLLLNNDFEKESGHYFSADLYYDSLGAKNASNSARFGDAVNL
jgi:hypothetical protein